MPQLPVFAGVRDDSVPRVRGSTQTLMTLPGILRSWIVLPSLILASLAAVSIANGSDALRAQETITIRGSVVAGTRDAELSSEIPVLLLISNSSGGLVATSQTVTDPGGRFQFDQAPHNVGGTYAFSVDYAGVFYSTSLSIEDLSDNVRLTVYEPTQDASVVKVARQILVIADVDEKNRQVSVLEFVLLTNTSDRTLVPDLDNPEQLNFLRFALPLQAEELDVRSDLPGGEIISIGTGFALTSAVTPGNHSLEFSFRFPYQGDSVSYRQSLPQGAEVYQVLVPERLSRIAVAPLQNVPTVDIESSLYRTWEGRDFGRGQGIVLELTNLPQPSLGARLEKSITDGTFWKIAIPCAFGAMLATLLLFGTVKSPGRVTEPVTVEPGGVTEDSAKRATLVQQIASLDERFHQGEVEETDYHHQREDLISRILGPGEPNVGDKSKPPEGPLQE